MARQRLYEVVGGVYQARGLELSDMTFVERERGVVTDPIALRRLGGAGAAPTRTTDDPLLSNSPLPAHA